CRCRYRCRRDTPRSDHPLPHRVHAVARLRIAVLASGRGSNLQALIDAQRAAVLPVEIVLVASDKVAAAALRRAEDAGIATLALDPTGYASRAAYAAELFTRDAEHTPDLVVL